MHAAGVFHRDIKPGNILVSRDCQLRITDFGLARFMDEQTLVGENPGNPMTEYVVTRWYRSPELLLAPNRPYSAAIDMWSIGCIIAEMIRRKPLFPGKSHTHQVQMVLEVRGYSSPADLGFPLTDETKSFLSRRCTYPGQLLSNAVQHGSRDVMELIEALLQLNPQSRPSAEHALKFKFLNDAQVMHDYSKVHVAKPKRGMFSFENEKMSLASLRAMVLDEVRSYNNTSSCTSPVDEIDALVSKLLDVRHTEKKVARTPSKNASEVYTLEGNIVDEENRPKSVPVYESIVESIPSSVVAPRPRSASNPATAQKSFDLPADVTFNRGINRTEDLMNRKSFFRNGDGFADDMCSSEYDIISKRNVTLLPPVMRSEKAVAKVHSDVTRSKILPSFSFGLTSFRERALTWGPSERESLSKKPVTPNKVEILMEKDRNIKRKFYLQSIAADKSSLKVENREALDVLRISEAIAKGLIQEKLPKSPLTNATGGSTKSGIISAIRNSFSRRPTLDRNPASVKAAKSYSMECSSHPTESDDYPKVSSTNSARRGSTLSAEPV